MRPATLLLLPLVAGAAAPALAAPAPRPGLWIGPIHACRSTVAEVVVGASDYDDRRSAVVRFREGWADVLHRVTAARVEQTMAVRLDGRIITEPVVREPIVGGVILLMPIEAGEAEAIRAAAGRTC